jgi:hypothetical protein
LASLDQVGNVQGPHLAEMPLYRKVVFASTRFPAEKASKACLHRASKMTLELVS